MLDVRVNQPLFFCFFLKFNAMLILEVYPLYQKIPKMPKKKGFIL